MNAIRPMFRPNGNGYDISATGVLLFCADVVYGDPDETSPTGSDNAQAMIDGILNAAYRGGFRQGDILQTMMAQGRTDERTLALAQLACDMAGGRAIADLFARMKPA